jgi:glycine cleavage system H protein
LLILDELCYSEEHIWVRRDGDHTVTLGITDYAQSELGDLDYVELPNEGDEIIPYESFGSIECSRIVTDLYAPLAGYVLEINQDVLNEPGLINESPYKEGWIIRARLSNSEDLDGLMSADDYEDYVLDGSL